MFFDPESFAQAFQKLSGDDAALTAYLEEEFWKLKDARSSGAVCGCCGQSTCRVEEDDVAWQKNRLQGQLTVGGELANCYCKSRAWDKCFALYDELETLLRGAGLEETEAYACVLLNRAYAEMEHGETEHALELARDVESRLDKADSTDAGVRRMLRELIATGEKLEQKS